MEKKALRGRLHRTAKEGICFLVPLSLAAFFLFRDAGLPKDLNHNVANLWYFNSLVKKAHAAGVPVSALIAGVCKRWSSIPGYFFKGLAKWYVFGVPLTQVWILLTGSVLAPGAKSAVMSSSLAGLIAVAVTYISGRLLFGLRAAVFSAIYLSTSLIFLLTVRNGYIFYALDSLCGISALLFFYLAHKSRKPLHLYLSAAAFSIGWFNGYSMFLVFMPVILAAFVLYCRGRDDYFTFSWKAYAKAFVLAAVFCLSFSAAYSIYAGVNPFYTFYEMHHFFFWRSGSMSFPLFKIRFLLHNLKRGILILFYKSYLPPSDIASADNMAPYGHPGFPLPVAIFMLYGFWAVYRRREMAGKLLLIAAGVSAFFVFLIFPFDTRYMMVTLPVFYLIAGVGTVEFVETVSSGSKSSFLKSGALALVLLAAAWAGYAGYNFYFKDYADHDGYLGRFDGQVRAGRYVAKHFGVRDTMVVLDDKMTVPEDIFAFSTMPESFDYRFWQDVRGDLPAFENETFRKKSRIVFVFSNGNSFLVMPGNRDGEPVDWSAFTMLHPDIVPVKVISSAGGWPLLSIFELRKDDRIERTVKFDDKHRREDIINGSHLKITALKFSGKMEDPEISIDGRRMRFALRMLPSTEMIFRPEGTSKLRFAPCLGSAGSLDDIYALNNVGLNRDDQRFLELKGSGEGTATYRIEAPVKMTSMRIETHPRIYNDRHKKNGITAFYSSDGRKYSVLYRVDSNGSGKWDPYFYRDTFNVIRPDSKTVYVKFVFRGEGSKSQLWSPPPVDPLGMHDVMKFIAELDFAGFRTKLKDGLNRLAVSGGLAPGSSVDIYMRRVKN